MESAIIHVLTIIVGAVLCAALSGFIFKRFISHLKMGYNAQMLIMVPIFMVIMIAYGVSLIAIWNSLGLIGK
jgi:Kef-type K+ transport system membrane component KefB